MKGLKNFTETKRIVLNNSGGGVISTITTCYARASVTNFLGSETTNVKQYNTRLACVMIIVDYGTSNHKNR